MTNFSEQLLGFGENQLLVFFLVFIRVGAAIALLPVVGERAIPQRVRLVLALVFTVIIAPTVFGSFDVSQIYQLRLVKFLITEIVAGLAIGLSLRLFVFALQIAGSIAAQSTSLSQIFGGAGVDPQPAIGHLLVSAGLALAVTFGLHVQMAELLIFSYQVLVPGNFIPANDLSEWGVSQIAHAFALAFSLAAPFVVASLIYNIALGAINRAMPQLMVSFVGAPAITAGGLILLLLAAPLMLSTWIVAINEYLTNPFGIAP